MSHGRRVGTSIIPLKNVPGHFDPMICEYRWLGDGTKAVAVNVMTPITNNSETALARGLVIMLPTESFQKESVSGSEQCDAAFGSSRLRFLRSLESPLSH